jgi:hypothetical protein
MRWRSDVEDNDVEMFSQISRRTYLIPDYFILSNWLLLVAEQHRIEFERWLTMIINKNLKYHLIQQGLNISGQIKYLVAWLSKSKMKTDISFDRTRTKYFRANQITWHDWVDPRWVEVLRRQERLRPARLTRPRCCPRFWEPELKSK